MLPALAPGTPVLPMPASLGQAYEGGQKLAVQWSQSCAAHHEVGGDAQLHC